jgi:hypothetical protein
MPGLRLLLRLAPFLVGAVAAAVWLRRRQAGRPLLGPAPRRAELPRPASDAPEPRPERAPSGRFERAPHADPVSIVTVVDDLLGAGL